VAKHRINVKLTARFESGLDEIEQFLDQAGAATAFDQLLHDLRNTVIPNLQQFPNIGRRYLDDPPQSAEAIRRLALLPSGVPEALRQYIHGDYTLLYLLADDDSTVWLLALRHHRQMQF